MLLTPDNADIDPCEVAESCVCCRCGCCKDGCPVYEVVLEESMSPKGRNELIRALHRGVVEPDERAMRIIYSCLLCRWDEFSCGAELRNAEATEEFRRHLLRSGVKLLPEHDRLAKNLGNYGNPWGEPRASRRRWAKDRPSPGAEAGEGGDMLFIGCTYSLDRSLHETPKALVSIMEKAGVDFRVMLENELCCGSTVRRLGDEVLFEKTREENAEAITDSNHRTLVTPCAGCYKTLSQDYGELLEGVRVMHSTQYLLELIREGRLAMERMDSIVTYHDPCHLGRHAGIYEEPRAVLSSIPGLQLVEMKNSRELARCCGGGGVFGATLSGDHQTGRYERTR